MVAGDKDGRSRLRLGLLRRRGDRREIGVVGGESVAERTAGIAVCRGRSNRGGGGREGGGGRGRPICVGASAADRGLRWDDRTRLGLSVPITGLGSEILQYTTRSVESFVFLGSLPRHHCALRLTVYRLILYSRGSCDYSDVSFPKIRILWRNKFFFRAATKAKAFP